MRLSASLRRRRRLVFACWLLALLPAVLLTVTHNDKLTGGGFEVAGSQSLQVQYELEDHFPEQGASPLALVAAPRADATYADMAVAVEALTQAAATVPSLSVVTDPLQPPPAPDRPYVVALRLDFDNTGAVDVARQLRSRIGIDGDRPGEIDNGRVRLYVIGQGALGAAAATSTRDDIAAAERWNLPVVLMILLAVFGSLAAAAVPLLFALCTVVVTMGAVYLLSTLTTMSVFVTSTVSMFGIALAVDYSLFILMRYREELRAGRTRDEATDAAMSTSGLAVVLSGLTVIASLTGIYLIDTPVLWSMATGAILAVTISVLTATTLTPAVLATFGRAIARHSSLLRWSPAARAGTSGFWERWVTGVMRKPWLSAAAATVALLLLAAPAFSMVLGNSLQRQFPSSHEIRGGVAAAAQALGPGALGPVRILVTFPDGGASDPANAGPLEALNREARREINIVSVSPPVFSDDNRSALLSAVLTVDPEDLRARETVDRLRATLPALPETAAVQIDVGGPTALIKDFDDRVAHTQLLVFGFVSLVAFVMLLISVRSVVLALKGVLMTVLSVGAAYGSLVIVFQWGWLSRLGFEPISSIDSTIPPLVLAMTFGLSMDYEIFLLSRIRERYLQSGDTRDAVTYGVSTCARTITSAALIMIAVFTGFAFAGMPLVAQLGVACAVAIAVDATVVRLVLVPALMAMFDRWNWWLPDWLARLLPAVDFDRQLPRAPGGDVVVLPEQIAAAAVPAADLHAVLADAGRLRRMAPRTVGVPDPLALRGSGTVPAGAVGQQVMTHPVHLWRARLEVALDALGNGAAAARRSPLETVTVALPGGERVAIPTTAEALRMKGYLVLYRNTRRDYAGLVDLVDSVGVDDAAAALAGIDGHYDSGHPQPQWIATQLVRRLADPEPVDGDADWTVGPGRWTDVRRRCLALAVTILEEAS